MFIKVVCSLLLLGSSFLQTFGLSDEYTELLTSLQTDHYGYVKTALETAEALASRLYFIDDDLKSNAQTYFHELADDELEQLAPLKEACEENDDCLACFDSESQLSKIAANITAELTKFFDDQKVEFNSTISDITQNLLDSALLSTTVYAQYRDSTDFETNARNYYEKIRKALVYETDLFNRTIKATSSKLVQYSVDATVDATNQLEGIFNTIVECADEALNPPEQK